MSRPTIDDVARRAGFSKATVSAVLNDSAIVADDTRAAILEAIHALNYRPRSAARKGFRTGKSLGLVIKEVQNPYYADIIAGVHDYASQKGYTVLSASSEGDFELEQRIVTTLREGDADGLIIIPLLGDGTDFAYLFDLMRRHCPFVLLEALPGVPASVIDVDNVRASKQAAKWLIDQGHDRLIHFAGPSYSMHSEQRIEGVRRAFSESRLVFDADVVVPVGASLREGYEAGRACFEGGAPEDRPTAVTCYNDLVAIGLMSALAQLGLRVPEDVSVIGYDDIDLLAYLTVPLTTVRVPRRRMGHQAAELLIHHIEAQEKPPPQKIYLDAELIIRGSAAAPGAAAPPGPGA